MVRWDLSYADLGYRGWGGGGKKKAIACRFVGIRIEGNLGNHFVDCNFSGARLICGFFETFERCNFRRADLRGSHGDIDPRFVECDFTLADLRGVDLGGIVFDRCVWDGTKFGGGAANGTQWIKTRPTDEQLGDTFIMTPDEAARERQVAEEIEAEMRREAAAARNRSKPRRS
jgi:uncharacterized protein YjbI with pentapeptide repeats